MGGDDKVGVIRKVFKAARGKSKDGGLVILWFEDIDFVCTANGKNLEMMYAFMAELDSLSDSDKILILATTS